MRNKGIIALISTTILSLLIQPVNAQSHVEQKYNKWIDEGNKATYSYVESYDDGKEYSYVITLQLSPEQNCLMPEIAVLFMKGRTLGQPISQEQVDPSALLIVFDKENAYRNMTFQTKYTNGVEYGTRLTNEALHHFKSSKKTIFKLINEYFVTTNNETLPTALQAVSSYCFEKAKAHY